MSAERRNVPAIVEAATPTLRISLAVAGGAGDRGCCGRQPVVRHYLGLWGHCAPAESHERSSNLGNWSIFAAAVLLTPYCRS